MLYSAIIIGAGPAGLAASHGLKKNGIDHVVLEAGPQIAFKWTQLYDSLTLHTGKHMSALPGMPFPKETPLFPSRIDFLDYLSNYTKSFQLPIRTGCEVIKIERLENRWKIFEKDKEWESVNLVVATGILSSPNVPNFPGQEKFRGRILHSVDYRRPDPFIGHRVLVIGVGNSGGEISAELAKFGAKVTIAVRSGALILPRALLGIPIQYYSCIVSYFPRKVQQMITAATSKVAEIMRGKPVLPKPPFTECPDVPLIGFHLADAIRRGSISVKGAISEFLEDGVKFVDGTKEVFDNIICATGYHAAVGILQGLIQMDHCGFARRKNRIESLDQPNLYFIGHNYDGTGGLFNIARDSKILTHRLSIQNSKNP